MAAVLFAVGIVLVFEGLVYALVPGQMRRMAELMRDMPEEQLRITGTAALGVGVLLLWLTRVIG